MALWLLVSASALVALAVINSITPDYLSFFPVNFILFAENASPTLAATVLSSFSRTVVGMYSATALLLTQSMSIVEKRGLRNS